MIAGTNNNNNDNNNNDDDSVAGNDSSLMERGTKRQPRRVESSPATTRSEETHLGAPQSDSNTVCTDTTIKAGNARSCTTSAKRAATAVERCRNLVAVLDEDLAGMGSAYFDIASIISSSDDEQQHHWQNPTDKKMELDEESGKARRYFVDKENVTEVTAEASVVRMEDSDGETYFGNRGVVSKEDSTSNSKAGVARKSSRMMKLLLCLALLLLLCAAVLGGICGSGMCTADDGNTNKSETESTLKNLPTASPVSSPQPSVVMIPSSPPTASPTTTRQPSVTTLSDVPQPVRVTTLPKPFTSTKELYQAVDEYMLVMNDVDTAKSSPVAQKYGYPIGTWDVSRITNFTRVFDPDRRLAFDPLQKIPVTQESTFNKSLGGWNVSAATTMFGMFRFAASFEGNGLSSWNVSSVRDMSFMFQGAHRFRSDLSLWDVSSVETMEAMFRRSVRFNSDISGWTVSKVTNMNRMFQLAFMFSQNLCEWGRQLPPDTVSVEEIFAVSGCPEKMDPAFRQKGPWCQKCDAQ